MEEIGNLEDKVDGRQAAIIDTLDKALVSGKSLASKINDLIETQPTKSTFNLSTPSSDHPSQIVRGQHRLA